MQSRDPVGAARLWSDLLQAERDGASLQFDGATVRFVESIDADGSGIIGIDIAVSDPASVLRRARAVGVPVLDGKPQLGGVSFTLTGK